MGQPRLKWGQAKRYFERRGFVIIDDGGDKIIQAPKNSAVGSRPQVRIGHTSSRNAGTEMLRCYASALQRAFGVTIKDILDD